MWENIVNYINDTMWLKITIDAYLIFIVVSLLVFMIAYSRRAFYLFFTLLILFGVAFLANSLDLPISKNIYKYFVFIGGIFAVCVIAPDFRNISYKQDLKDGFVVSSDNTKTQIVDAVMYLASKKIGALITMERHNSLDQFAEKAIQLNSDVSKELLINIFTPNTPLHDGAVIMRGNKIRCAGAYYVLTQHDEIDKTTGSRHRAGLGISEVTDSFTIIVSEETGNVSVATEGFIIKINDREKLGTYIDMFIDKK